MNASAESQAKANLKFSKCDTLPQQGNSSKRTNGDGENSTTLPLAHDIAQNEGTFVMSTSPVQAMYKSNVTSVGGQRIATWTNATACENFVPPPSFTERSLQPWDFRNPTADFAGFDAYNAALSTYAMFGRDPACTAAYSSFKATRPMTLYTEACFTSSTMANGAYSYGVAYNVQTLSAGTHGVCCAPRPFGNGGNACTVRAGNLQLIYWLPPIPNTSCLENVASNFSKYTGHSNQTTISPQNVASNLTVFATESNGYTYTWPSMYLDFQDVSANDGCGPLGPTLTSITLPFASGELFTLGPNSVTPWISSFALNTNDLPCGPCNGCFDSQDLATTLGGLPRYSSYSPIFVMPSKLIDLVPAWSDCVLDQKGVLDPPRALSPASAMVPVPTSADSNSQTIPATPSPPMASSPVETGVKLPHDRDETPRVRSLPIANSPSNADLPSKTKPSTTLEYPHGAVSLDVNQVMNGPAKNLGGVTAVSRTPKASALDPGESSEYSSLFAVFPPEPTVPLYLNYPADLRIITAVSSNIYELMPGPAPPLIETGGDPQGKGPPDLDPERLLSYIQGSVEDLATTNDSDPPTATIGGPVLASQAYNSDSFVEEPMQQYPPALVIGGQKITNNADPTTVEGARVLYQSGDLNVGDEVHKIPAAAGQGQRPEDSTVVGGLTFSFLPAAAPETSAKQDFRPIVGPFPINVINSDKDSKEPESAAYITIGGQTFSVESNAVQVAGNIILPGDPVVTVNGMPVQYGRSELLIGTRSESLPPQSADIKAQESLITVGHEVLTLEAKNMIVGGTTLQPGDPPITTDETPSSLGSSDFVIGTHAQNLAIISAATALNLLITVGKELMTPTAGKIIVGGSTLRLDDPATTIDGMLVRLQSSDVVIGTRTERLPLATMDTLQDSLITIGNEVITPEAGDIVVGGSTLTPGGSTVTIDGIPILLGSSVLNSGSQITDFTLPTPAPTPNHSGDTSAGILPALSITASEAGAAPSPITTTQNEPSSGHRNIHMLERNGKLPVSIMGCFAVTVAVFAANIFG